MTYNGTQISVEDTALTARLLIDGKEVDRFDSKNRDRNLSGTLPSGESVKVEIYGIFVGKFRLIIGDRVITDNWC